MPLLTNPGRALLWGARAPMQARSVLWTKARGSGGVLVDGSGRGHAIQHGSAAGADSNDPLWLPNTGTQYLYLPGSSGNYASTPDSAAVSVTGDIDLRVWLAATDWTPGSPFAALSKYLTTGNQRSWIFYVSADGTLRWIGSQNGTTLAVDVSSSVATAIADGAAKWIRVTRNATTGNVQFFLSDDGAAWTQLGTTRSGATGALFDSTAAVEIGSDGGGAEPGAGNFYRTQIYGDLLGTDLRFDADFTDASRLVEPFSTFAEKSSNAATVTINRSASGRKASVVDRDCYELGTDDEFLVTDADDLDVPAGQSFTVFVLVRQHTTPTSSGRYAGKQTTAAGYRLTSNGTSIQPQFQVSDGTNSASANGPAFSAGTLTLLAGVRDAAAGKIRCYADGFGADVSDPSGDLSNALSLAFGARSDGANFQDFVIMGGGAIREALSASDLARAKAELLS